MSQKTPWAIPDQPKKKGWHPTRPSTSNYKSFSVSTIKRQCPGRIFICTISSGIKSFKDCGVVTHHVATGSPTLGLLLLLLVTSEVLLLLLMSHTVIAIEIYH